MQRLRALVVAGMVVIAGTYLLTPPAWLEPVRFVRESIAYMGHHAWVGCTLTDGVCLKPSAEGWSATEYLVGWLSVRWPLLLLVFSAPACAYLLIRGEARERVVVVAALMPLLLIAARDSALYNGIRHILFVIPPLIVAVAVFMQRISRTRIALRRGLAGLVLCSLALFVADNVRLYPYNYVYFNEMGRQKASATTYELDYWGLSLRRAAGQLPALADGNVSSPASYYATPLHLIGPFADTALTPVDGRVDPLPDTPYLWIAYTKNNLQPPENCHLEQGVTRRSFLTAHKLQLSTLAVCEGALGGEASLSAPGGRTDYTNADHPGGDRGGDDVVLSRAADSSGID